MTSAQDGHPAHDEHGHAHGHAHGHDNDQGIQGALRYLRWLPQMWRSPINDAVIELVDPQPGERVLDIGAGMGAGAVPAAARGASVLAVEPTPFVRRALRARRAVSRHRKRLTVLDGSAERIPVPDHSVDALWAVNTMHHWVDVEKGAAEIARVLRPGGRVLLIDEVFTDPAHPEHDRFGADHGPEHHGFTMVEADRMGALLRGVGLANVDASNRAVAGRPAICVTAHGPAPSVERDAGRR